MRLPVLRTTADLSPLYLYPGLCFPLLLSGCSIAMALHGHPEPNFERIQVGATRQEVELELGKPVSNRALDNGSYEETFRYEMANSSNPGRATVYGYIDVATIGLAEPILTLIELFQGHKEETIVILNSDDRVTEIAGYMPEPLSPALLSAAENQSMYTGAHAHDIAARSGTDGSEGLSLAVDAKMTELAHRLSTSLKNHKVDRIAVLPVRDSLGNENQAFGNYLTEKLTAKLHVENVAKIVERAQLTKVAEELSLTYSGNFDEDSAMKVGSLLGVEALVSTLYADIGPSSIEVNSKVVRVDTGEILGVGSTALPRVAVERMLPK